MPDFLPATTSAPHAVAAASDASLAPWTPSPAPEEPNVGERVSRAWKALLRYKWLVAAIVATFAGLGILASRLIKPEYEVRSTIWIASPDARDGQRRGPIRADELLRESAWVELFQSFTIVDAVVLENRLYLKPSVAADSALFSTFEADERLIPGRYVLTLAPDRRQYVLATADGQAVERGAVGDSIGRPLGFRWIVPPGMLRPGRDVAFTVVAPREASMRLLSDVDVNLPRGSNFMRVTLRGGDRASLATTMNSWISQFVSVSASLKKRNLVEFARILQGQLSYAERQLKSAEYALQSFRVNTITLPSEGAPIAAGLEMTRDPVFNNFFQQKVDYDNVRRDREALERLIAAARANPLSAEDIYAIPGLLDGPSGEALRGIVADLGAKQAQLAALRQTYTDEYKPVKDLAEQTRRLREEAIPGIARTMLEQLRTREADLGSRIAGASREMRDIPTRTIEEMRLRREVTVAENLYTSLQNRYEEAKLAEASAVPDVSILDSAVQPQRPASNRAPVLIALCIAAGFGVAVALALLLDHLDPRFRYMTQATSELGLHVIGAVPTIRRGRGSAVDLEEAAQVVESFRSIRLNLRHAFDAGGPIIFTVSSPGVHDGKSLVSSNLALAFAEAGYRTVLVDGDARRGEQHAMFGVAQYPGLLDFLSGDVGLDDVVRRTAHEKLTLVPCGRRRHQAPELVASPSMSVLLGELVPRYDVIVVDSPPLSAGIDPYALSTATGNLLLVLRAGETDRKLAQAKLRTLQQLPVRLLGAVLNDVRTTEGEYRYYSYDYSYATSEDPARPQSRSRVGAITHHE